ncbi:MAG: hypothetical protein P8Z81_07255 [Deinococcales bacterium]
MVKVSVQGSALAFDVEGLDKILAFRGHLEVPLRHVRDARADPSAAREWRKLKLVGANVPGVVTAGTFLEHGRRVFWDVHDPEKAVVVGLSHERYDELVVQVEDPDATVRLIAEALDRKR